tara:strand:- start:774 stop:974 length:201 start_codon:yes stop_codon:yes gene_type:complete
MKRQKLTQQEKEERDFKQFSIICLRMIAQACENPKQLRRLKAWRQFLDLEIKGIEERKVKKTKEEE